MSSDHESGILFGLRFLTFILMTKYIDFSVLSWRCFGKK